MTYEEHQAELAKLDFKWEDYLLPQEQYDEIDREVHKEVGPFDDEKER